MAKPEFDFLGEDPLVLDGNDRFYTPKNHTTTELNTGGTVEMLERFAKDPDGISGNPLIGGVARVLLDRGEVSVFELAEELNTDPGLIEGLNQLSGVFEITDGNVTSPLLKPRKPQPTSSPDF